MNHITIHEADMASPHRYPDPKGGTEPHPFAGKDDPDNPGEKFPATRPKTLGKLFARVNDVEGAVAVGLPADVYDTLRRVALIAEGAALDAEEAATVAKSESLAQRRAELDARLAARP